MSSAHEPAVTATDDGTNTAALRPTPGTKATKKKKKRIAIDGRFFKKLRGLLRIVMPSWRSKPALLLAMHTSFLLARTFVSILVARLDGALVKACQIVDIFGCLSGVGWRVHV